MKGAVGSVGGGWLMQQDVNLMGNVSFDAAVMVVLLVHFASVTRIDGRCLLPPAQLCWRWQLQPVVCHQTSLVECYFGFQGQSASAVEGSDLAA